MPSATEEAYRWFFNDIKRNKKMSNDEVGGCFLIIVCMVLVVLGAFVGYGVGSKTNDGRWEKRLLEDGAYVQTIENNRIVLTLKEKKGE